MQSIDASLKFVESDDPNPVKQNPDRDSYPVPEIKCSFGIDCRHLIDMINGVYVVLKQDSIKYIVQQNIVIPSLSAKCRS